jgi:hypothetical protein
MFALKSYKATVMLIVFTGLFTEISNLHYASSQNNLERFRNISALLKDGKFDFPVMDIVELRRTIDVWHQTFILIGSVLTNFGIVFNILSMVVFWKSKLYSNSSFPLYIYTLSVISTMNLLIRFVLPLFMENFVRSKLLNQYNATTEDEYEIYTGEIVDGSYCGTYMYLHNTFGLIWAWLFVGTSLDRWLLIRYPSEQKHAVTLRAILILYVIISCCFIINVFDFSDGYYQAGWYSNITLFCEPIDSKTDYGLRARFGSITVNSEAYAIVRVILQSIIPFYLTMIFNGFVIVGYRGCNKASLSEIEHMTSIKYDTDIYIPVAQHEQDQTTNRVLKNTYLKNSSRETDSMFAVLSFTILLLQLPGSMAWYLIYYRLSVKTVSEVFSAANAPMVMCLLKLVEMGCFSLNLVYYLLLNTPLKRELLLRFQNLLLKLLRYRK